MTGESAEGLFDALGGAEQLIGRVGDHIGVKLEEGG